MMHSGVQEVTLNAHPQPELSQVGDFLSVTLQVSDKLCWSQELGPAERVSWVSLSMTLVTVLWFGVILER